MKTISALFTSTIIFFLLMNSDEAFAQVPQAINYQAVARDVSGNPLVSATINIDAIIHSGTATGPAVYYETFSPVNTNLFGLFTLALGTGTVSLGGRGNLQDWEIFNRPNNY